MIKMVACDVDGTLLKKGETALRPEIIRTIKKLIDKGVLFAAASGRTYTDLKRLFKDIENDIVFVADDGALTVYKGNVLAKYPIAHKEGFEFMKKAYKTGCIIPVVYGAYMAYVLREDGDFVKKLKDALNNHVLETDCLNSIGDDYLKIGFYIKERAEGLAEAKTAVFKEIFSESVNFAGLNLIYKGSDWLEYVADGVHKGKAVRYLQKRFAISKAETMAFGDNTNDIGMFEQADFAYAAGYDIAPEIRQKCGYVTKDVVGTLCSVFGIDYMH